MAFACPAIKPLYITSPSSFLPTLTSCRPRPRTFPRATTALLIDFDPSDFEIRRVAGQQGYATITDWEYYGGRDPTAPTRTVEASEPAVRLYEAKIVRGDPRLYNTRVLLKEFLTDGVELGVNEAGAYKTLYEADGQGIDPDTIPVATLLGTFLTDDSFSTASFAAAWASRFPKTPTPPRAGAPFLVFRWEGMLTGLNVATGAGDGDIGTRMLDKWLPSNLVQRKRVYLKAFMRKALEALLYVHATGGIVHRSMGLASIMVNTVEYRLASSLQVKIRDFGFAKPVSEVAVGSELEKARKAGAVSPASIANFYFAEDIYALGYAFMEVVFSTFSGRPVTQDVFKKLFEDTFNLDIASFRDFCAEDSDWTTAVEFLDANNRSGWELLKTMLSARETFATVSLESILTLPFFISR